METIKKLWENKMMRIFVIAIAVILVLIIIIMIAVGGKSTSINDVSLVNAAKRYFSSNSALLPINNYDAKNVSLSTLIANGYLDSDSKGASCSSYVTVTKVDNNYEYIPFIKCGNDTDTMLLGDKLLSNTVTTGTGLYQTNDGYIYKGENPNNYVRLGNPDEGSLWRITGLDSSNSIKMIFSGNAADHDSWDEAYNVEFDDQVGINDYELSDVKEYLDDFFNTYSTVFTPSLRARLAKFNVCVGKIDMSSNLVNPCSEMLEGTSIGMLNVNEYINASLDTNCSVSNTKSCQNYNFLNNNSWTITADSTDSSKVYYIDDEEGIQSASAFTVRAFLPVIALKSNTIIVSGTGTQIDPYIVK